MATAPIVSPQTTPREQLPPLENGDRLTRTEFERRFDAMPNIRKAELIEGVVYMPSPVNHDMHGRQHFDMGSWLGLYRALTPGVEGGCESSIQLDWDNEPQPDAFLRILPSHGGHTKTTENGYISSAPELIAEVAASSVSYDLHVKLNVYRRNAVLEYIVWRVYDGQIDWFVLEECQYVRLPLDDAGHYKSRVFPGLWLDPAALLHGDMPTVMKVLQQGLESIEHAEFVTQLERKSAERRETTETRG